MKEEYRLILIIMIVRDIIKIVRFNMWKKRIVNIQHNLWRISTDVHQPREIPAYLKFQPNNRSCQIAAIFVMPNVLLPKEQKRCNFTDEFIRRRICSYQPFRQLLPNCCKPDCSRGTVQKLPYKVTFTG